MMTHRKPGFNNWCSSPL